MLAVAGGKGGCGKTTTVLGVGRALRRDVVAVDVDRDMPNLHAMAGVEREPTAVDVAGGASPHPVEPGLSVYPAPPPETPDSAVPTLVEHVDHATAGTVVVDCPGGAGPDAAAPLSAASSVLLVSTPCAPPLRDTAMARALGCAVEGVVLTRTSVRPAGVETLFDCPILGTIPTASPPIVTAERARDAYAELVDELAVCQKPHLKTARTG